jgi:hypothetical protein
MEALRLLKELYLFFFLQIQHKINFFHIYMKDNLPNLDHFSYFIHFQVT